MLPPFDFTFEAFSSPLRKVGFLTFLLLAKRMDTLWKVPTAGRASIQLASDKLRWDMPFLATVASRRPPPLKQGT